MTKTKSTKRALLTSALALFMCVSMLIGSTFAWFTDSVTSGNNKIQAGTLKIDLELLEKNGSWTSIKDSRKAIFDYQNWEPGYTDVKILKVTNEGTLALKWIAKFVSANDLTELANVIDVYVKPSTTEFGYATDRTDLSTWTKKGTVAEFVNTISETTYGNLEAGASAYLGIALKMQETAGNKYQGMDLGGAFDIMILATQYTSESDSFNNQYDANAKYDVDVWDGKTITAPVADADGVYHISTAAELVGMMNDSKYPNCNKYQNVVLENNIDLAGRTVSGFGDDSGFFDGIFDGQGYTISNFKIDATNRTYYAGLFNQVSQYSGENTVIKNLTVADATIKGTSQVGAIVGGMNGNTVVENCKVINCDLYATKKVGSVVGYTAGGTVKDCYAENCTVLYSEKEGGQVLGFENTGSTVTNNTAMNVTVAKSATVSAADDLSTAISNGATNITLAKDMTIAADSLKAASSDLTVTLAADTTVTVASGAAASKDLTFTGDKSSNVVFVNTNPGYEGKLAYHDNANLTFKGITFDANQISGICARGGVVTFVDCFITGELEQTIASKFVFSGCTFDVGVTQVGYGCSDVVFDNCKFETDGYGIKIYSEGQTPINLTVKNSSFKNTGSSAKSAILLDHIMNGITYNITVENCTFDGFTATPTPNYNKWAERMIVVDSFVKTADGQYIFSYQTGVEGGNYHKILSGEQLVVTVK